MAEIKILIYLLLIWLSYPKTVKRPPNIKDLQAIYQTLGAARMTLQMKSPAMVGKPMAGANFKNVPSHIIPASCFAAQAISWPLEANCKRNAIAFARKRARYG
jgi:hypothetical protein